MECDSLVWQVSCVSTTVPVQFAPVTETLFTHGTGKGTLPRMPSEMSHVTFMSHEPLTHMIIFHFSIASKIHVHLSELPHLTAVVATKWEIPCVSPLMTHQFITVPKLFLAEVTGVAFCVLVNPSVFRQMFSFSKTFAAYFTNKSFADGTRTALTHG